MENEGENIGSDAYNIPKEYLNQQGQQRQNLPAQNTVEFLQFVLDPQMRGEYTHITKDLATSNADFNEIKYIDLNLKLLHLIDYIELKKTTYKFSEKGNAWVLDKEGDLAPIKHIILKDIYSFLQLLRSKNGFERTIEATQIFRQQSSFQDQTGKKGWRG